MFKKILIANRGEIAVRIIRTCRDMDIASVAVYDDSDLGSLHVLLADESVRLESAQGYVDQAQLIKLALSRNADAIHPGYGFLAEDAEFARACASHSLTFIGPSPQILEICSSKVEMLQKASSCGVSVPLNSERAFEPVDIDAISRSADLLGYPVYVKALKGRSGRAGRIVHNSDELRRSVELSSRQGKRLFNEKRVYLEKALLPARTIQVQFLSDGNGKVQALGTIDVSVQRHSTRILCESPAPLLSNESELKQAAEKLVRRLNYRGLGAIEFLLDNEGKFYFLELQARMQVEHAVSEVLSGLDLVHEQIMLASAGSFSEPKQAFSGTAMQCRLYAEDLLRKCLPSPGLLRRFRLPGGPNLRVDAYGYAGCRIPTHFDPLLATITSRGETRDECLRRMRRALRDTAITGVKTNLAYLQVLLHKSDFVSPGFISDATKQSPRKLNYCQESNSHLAALVAIAFKLRSQRVGFKKPERLSGGWHASSRTLD